MTPWILAVLGLWVAQTFMPTTMRNLQSSDVTGAFGDHMRGKDNAPELSPLAGRAQRAVSNLQEALPVFLTLALLCEFRGLQDGLAVRGAMVFFIARVLYVPAYLSAIFGLRSVMWTASWVGLLMMVAAIL